MRFFGATGADHIKFLYLIAGFLLAHSSFAMQTTLSAGSAVKYNSNAQRTDTNERSETEQSAILRFGLEQAGAKVIADMSYSANKNRYLQDRFDTKTNIDGRTNIEWKALPNRLSFQLDHSSRNTVSDSRLPNTPDNENKQEVVGAGILLQGRPSAVDDLSLRLHSSNVHIDNDSGNDNTSNQASLNWQHRLPKNKSLSIGSSFSSVEYDETDSTDYETQSFFVGFEMLLLKGQFALRGGTNKTNREGSDNIDNDIDGHTGRLSWTNISESAPFQWSIYYANELSNTSTGISSNGGFLLPETGAGNNFEINDITKTRLAGADFSYRFNRFNAHLELYWHHEKYDEQPLDERQKRIDLSLERRTTERLTGVLYVEQEKTKFIDDNSEQKELTSGIRCKYQITHKLDMSTEAYHVKRDHTLTTSDYEDDVVRVELMYTF